MEEVEHVIDVLATARKALLDKDAAVLRELSNETIHSATTHQDTGNISIAVLIYTLSKLVERSDNKKIKKWDKFVQKFNSITTLAIKALKEERDDKYADYLEQARKSLNIISGNLSQYIQEVLRKAEINKAAKIFEHGISIGRTAKLLGITQWELLEYTGQRQVPDFVYENPQDVKRRAKLALEFFS